MSSLDKMWTLLDVRIDDACRLSDDDFWRPFFMDILKSETRRLAVVSPFGPDVKYYAAHVQVEGSGNRERLCIVDNSGCVIVVRHHPDDVQSLTAAQPNFIQDEQEAFSNLKIDEIGVLGFAPAPTPTSGTLVVFLTTTNKVLSSCIDSLRDESEDALLAAVGTLVNDMVSCHDTKTIGFSFDPSALLVDRNESGQLKLLPLCFAGGSSSTPVRTYWSAGFVPKFLQVGRTQRGRPRPSLPPPNQFSDVYGVAKLSTTLLPDAEPSLHTFVCESKSNSTMADLQEKFEAFRAGRNDGAPSPGRGKTKTRSPSPPPPSPPPQPTAPRLADQIRQRSRRVQGQPNCPPVFKPPDHIVAADGQGGIRLVTVGPTEGIPKNELRILIVGATGAGKTTFLNGIANWLFGVRWTDPFRFKVITEQDEGITPQAKGNQAVSQTNIVTAYKFPWQPGFPIPFTVTVIDTPGFGDTRGMKHDQETVAQLERLFGRRSACGIDSLNAVAFVVQSALPRLISIQRYIFDSILKIFGKDIGNNIIIIATFADSSEPAVLHAIRDAQIPHKLVCKFNFSALFATTEGDDAKMNLMVWDTGVGNYERFFTELSALQPRSLTLTTQVLEERKKLHGHIDVLNSCIRDGVAKLHEIEQEVQMMNQYSREIEANRNFTTYVTVQKTRRIDLKPGEHVTNCHVCNQTCHYPCYIPDDSNKHQCSAMDSTGHCIKCSQHCHWSVHHNMQWRWEVYEVREPRTLRELKDKYGDATAKKQTKEKMLEQATIQYEATWSRTCHSVKEVKDSINRLHASALRPTTMSEIDYIDLQMETEKNQAASGWKSRVEFYQTARCLAQLERDVAEGTFNPGSVLSLPEITVHPDSQKFFSRILTRLVRTFPVK
jgi:hypothetical protein